MAVYFQSHTTGFNANVISAVPGKRIRVRRLIFSTAVNTSFTLRQDVGGGNQADIAATLQGRTGAGAMDLRFEQEMPQTAPGEALGYFTDGFGNYGVWIEYDLAD